MAKHNIHNFYCMCSRYLTIRNVFDHTVIISSNKYVQLYLLHMISVNDEASTDQRNCK